MTKSLHPFLFFALLLLGAQASSLRTVLNAYASRDGVASIQKDHLGFYVDVDYSQNPASGSEYGKFMISLWSPMSLFASNKCLGFTNYICSEHNCKSEARTFTYVHPFFSAETKRITAEAHLDHSRWNLKENAGIAQSCTSLFSNSIGTGRIGILGLNSGGDSAYNYQYMSISNKDFLISLNEDLSGGQLDLKNNQESFSSNERPISLSFPNRYEGRIQKGFVTVEMKSVSQIFSVGVMFDLHSDGIALPVSVYNFVIGSLAKNGVTCPAPETAKYKPQCTCTKKISDLPTLDFIIQGDKKMSLPSSVYILDPKTSGSQVTLNLKAVSPDLYNNNYVHKDFQDTIIFDARVLSHYKKLIFRQNSIDLYIRETESSSDSPGFVVVIIVLVVIVGIVAGVFIKKGKQNADNSTLQNTFIQGSPAPQTFHAQQNYSGQQNAFIPQRSNPYNQN